MKQPWLASRAYDAIAILSPPFLATLGVALVFAVAPNRATAPMGPWAWIVLILSIDVSHVYASVYRTLKRPSLWNRYRWPMIGAPLGCYALGYGLYRTDPLWFWRALAYLAVFHFVRQPYGLMLLYKRKAKREPKLWHRLDILAVYTASLYPLYAWHLDPSRQFYWFTPGDFMIVANALWPWQGLGYVFALSVLLIYIAKEVLAFRRGYGCNIPKNLVILGTAVSFGFGILYWNSDFAFTATNVISHGVVYLGLVWMTDGKRVYLETFEPGLRWVFPFAFISTLLFAAFIEEGLWDRLVWDDHGEIFSGFSRLLASVGLELSPVTSPDALTLLVPLLALPQATHYIWDGLIWRRPARRPGSLREDPADGSASAL
jgi:hypothetical protein